MEQSRFLTQGSIWKVLIRFTLPFLLANLLQALYGAVDLLVIGKFCSAASVAAVSTATQVTQIITSLITGFTLAGTVLVGKYAGMGKREKVERTIGTTVTFFGLFSFGFTLLSILAIPWVLSLLQVPEASYQEAYSYIFICCLGVFFICQYNALSAVLRGYGDSVSPLLFVAVACVFNIVGDIFTVSCLHMGPAGTALSTVISQGLSMGIAILHLNRQKFIFRFSLTSLGMDREILKELIRVGIPVSFQECMVRISFLYLTAITNSFGIYVSSAVGIAGKYDVFAMLPATSAANALTALTAQNLGAGKRQRARQFLKCALAGAFCCSLLFFLWAQFAPASMIHLFSGDEKVVQAGIPFFRSCSLDYLAVSVLFCVNGYLNGCEKTLFTMVNCCAGALIIRIPLLYFLFHSQVTGLEYYGLVSPASSLIMLGVILGYVIAGHSFRRRGTSPRFSEV